MVLPCGKKSRGLKENVLVRDIFLLLKTHLLVIKLARMEELSYPLSSKQS